ncbi:MAG: phosphate ABC transporter permease PstA [Polyangiaceae bacterium]|nr:phosphate ABC transporter permease PstA [Polyangiaceae bacterium]
MNWRRFRRKAANVGMFALATSAAATALGCLVWILVTLVGKGLARFDVEFFTALPTPPGMSGGGLSNAVVGTAIVATIAIAIGVPIGLLAGTFLAEYGQNGRLARAVRFVADVLMGAPSIVIGVFIYGLVVRPMGGFSGLAGGIALAVLMLPIVTRTTDEMLRLVPTSLREAALALGAPFSKMVTQIAFRAALPGILTGVLLAIARVSGETAPLLFTALNSPYYTFSPTEPMGTLNVTMFNYAMSPYEDWRRLAWTAALVITAAVLTLTILARALRRRAR